MTGRDKGSALTYSAPEDGPGPVRRSSESDS